MNTKYIQIRHFDYWTAYYEIDRCKSDDIKSVEFALSDDTEGEKTFFWLELFNQAYWDSAVNFEDENAYSKNIPDLLERLKKSEISFFVSAVYHPHFSETYIPEHFSEKTIFDMKCAAVPYYINVVIAETRAFSPDKLIEWLSVLSKPLFGEIYQFKFSAIPTKQEIEKEYWEDKKRGEMPCFQREQFDSLLKATSYGWSDFSLGEFSASVSGITCFPMDCVNGFIKALKGELPVAIGFDEEGSEFTLLLDIYDRVCVISHRDGESRLYKYPTTHINLADIFLNDMARDFDLYTNDDYYFDFCNAKQQAWKNEFYTKLKELETLVNKVRISSCEKGIDFAIMHKENAK